MTAPSASAAARGLLGTEAAREGPGDFAQGRMAARPCRLGHRTRLRRSVEVVAPVPRLSQGLRPWARGSGRTCVTPGNPSPARGRRGPRGHGRRPARRGRSGYVPHPPAHASPSFPRLKRGLPRGPSPPPLSVLVAKAADLARRLREGTRPGRARRHLAWASVGTGSGTGMWPTAGQGEALLLPGAPPLPGTARSRGRPVSTAFVGRSHSRPEPTRKKPAMAEGARSWGRRRAAGSSRA